MSKRHLKFHAANQGWTCGRCQGLLKPGYTVSDGVVCCLDCDACVRCPVESLKMGTRDVSFALKSFVAYRDRYKCRMCDQKVGIAYEIDHTKALQRGGSNLASNLELLCNSCHGRKSYLEQMGVVLQDGEYRSIYFT